MTRKARILVLVAGLASVCRGLFALEPQGLGVSVWIDGRAAPEYAARGRIYVEALRGKDFVIRLSNSTPERVAVALSVDGRNVIDAKRTTESSAAKWILMPGQTADIPGWQVSGQTSRRFFFTETSRSYAKWLGDTANVGTIEAVFFRERTRRPFLREKDEARTRAAEENARQLEAGAEGGVEGGVAGGIQSDAAASSAERGAAKAAPEAQAAQSAPVPRRKPQADRFAATGIGRETEFPVQWVAFDEDPSPTARIAIRYEFREQLVRLGVLPREDDLYARENARGFSHEYAPDPYRHP